MPDYSLLAEALTQKQDPFEFSRNNTKYASDLLAKAQQEYPFIGMNQPVVKVAQGEGYAETWPRGETGAPDAMGRDTRPYDFPMNQLGVTVHQPDKFTSADLAGEVLHVDPYANMVRDKLMQTMTPQQWGTLKNEALDYNESIRQGLSEQRAKENTIDSALRGYTVNQWPESVNQQLNYSPTQLELLNSLKTYMKTGKK
jgi:hypothetical protein